MKDSDAIRHERKATVLRVLQKLRDEFPLQQAIEGADPALRAAYVNTLSHWILHGLPPPRDCSSEAAIQALGALDALVIDECGIGCYPFSARETGIHVHFSGRGVSAMCAIDALAIPRLVQHVSRVTARCAVCGCHLACTVAANGSVEGGNPEGVRVVWRSGAAAEGACCHTLCPGIRFVCKHCAELPAATGLSLPEAAAVGNSLFAFQRRLLHHHHEQT
ncbi:organomercurial lyase [Herbaspirillum sp. VT-16-41]|uniref:organomercurial lyase n=1 Tax=Herbaspirillum sp. VT-16-41 TaxID=1953765 RepID=UPI00098118F4|nr:organomercurial lyase [Herbaspirillum sp. VT-16-41]ONN67843.1 alkylmercury lyase [Herbaspirillum sp. VT-16-41]